MAKVKIEDLVDHLSSEFKRALARAVRQEMPGVQFNESQLFRTFVRRLGSACSTWENVPDRYIEKD